MEIYYIIFVGQRKENFFFLSLLCCPCFFALKSEYAIAQTRTPSVRQFALRRSLSCEETAHPFLMLVGKILLAIRHACPEETQDTPHYGCVQRIQHADGEAAAEGCALQFCHSILREEIILLTRELTEAHECIADISIAVGAEGRHKRVANPIALRILLIVRQVMARVKLVRPNISLNLRAYRMEQGAQVDAVPLTHGGKPRRSRTAQNTHEHCLRQIIRMMGERYRIAVLLLLQPMEEIIAADARRRLKREFMHLRIARYVTCLYDAGNIARRTVCRHGICVRT